MTEKNLENLLSAALKAAKTAGASGADAVFIEGTDISVSQRLGVPEDAERAESAGLGLRVFVDGKYALASTTDLTPDALNETAERAVAMAKASIADAHSRLAEANEWAAFDGDLQLCDASELPLEQMQAQCAACEDAARSHVGITNSEGAEMSAAHHRIALASTAGGFASYETSSYSLSASVVGGEGDKMERDYAYSVARHADDVRAAEEVGNEAAKRTLGRLNPRKQSTQQVPVVFEPRVGKSLIGNFAAAISGSSVARGTSFLKSAMGDKLFADGIQIIDDPRRVRGLASKPFDGEGLSGEPMHLVEDGVLKHWLLDLRSASQLGLKSNARATRGLSSAPAPSATNLYLQAGAASPEELIAEIDSGLFVTDVFGMGVNLVTGDYSQGAAGFWIEKGELTYAVSELTIAGSLSDMFKGLTPANDLRFDYATNVPTLRIDQMTVAGA